MLHIINFSGIQIQWLQLFSCTQEIGCYGKESDQKVKRPTLKKNRARGIILE